MGGEVTTQLTGVHAPTSVLLQGMQIMLSCDRLEYTDGAGLA